MFHSRRVRIVRAFLIICTCAVFAETLNLSLLGYEQGLASERLLPALVFMTGISWQLIFQGPSPSEMMQRMRKRFGSDACTIDRVYLRFNIDRTIRVIIVLALLSTVCGLIPSLSGGQAWVSSGAAFLFALIAALRILVMRARISAERFGTNQYEARQLLAFLAAMYESAEGRFDPPGGLRRMLQAVETVAVPDNAEVAL